MQTNITFLISLDFPVHYQNQACFLWCLLFFLLCLMHDLDKLNLKFLFRLDRPFLLADGWPEPVNAYYESWIFPSSKFTESTISFYAALCQLLSLVYQSFHLSTDIVDWLIS